LTPGIVGVVPARWSLRTGAKALVTLSRRAVHRLERATEALVARAVHSGSNGGSGRAHSRRFAHFSARAAASSRPKPAFSMPLRLASVVSPTCRHLAGLSTLTGGQSRAPSLASRCVRRTRRAPQRARSMRWSASSHARGSLTAQCPIVRRAGRALTLPTCVRWRAPTILHGRARGDAHQRVTS
jgi:hypothetical protein